MSQVAFAINIAGRRRNKDHGHRHAIQSLESLLFFGFLVALGVLKPFKERLSSLADFAADREVDVALARLAAPGCEHALGNEVLLVVGQKDLGDLRDKLGMLVTHEALGATEEGFLVFLGSDHLLYWSVMS